MQLGKSRALSNQRWQHIVHPPCFRQDIKCKEAEAYRARLSTRNSYHKTIVHVCAYS